MITEQQADGVADKVNAKFGKEDWFNGVGVDVSGGDDYQVIVYSSQDKPASLPSSMDGVAIKVVSAQFAAQ